MDCDDDVVFVKEQIFVKYKEPVFIDLTGDDIHPTQINTFHIQ